MLGETANLFKRDASYTIKEDTFTFKKKISEKTFLKKINSQKSLQKFLQSGIIIVSSLSFFFKKSPLCGNFYSKTISSLCLIYYIYIILTSQHMKKNNRKMKKSVIHYYIRLLIFFIIFDYQKICDSGGSFPCITTNFWLNIGFILLYTRFDFQMDRLTSLLRGSFLLLSFIVNGRYLGFSWFYCLVLGIVQFLSAVFGGILGSYVVNLYSRDIYSNIDSLKRSTAQMFINFTEIPEPILFVDPESLRIIFYNLSGESFFNSHLREK